MQINVRFDSMEEFFRYVDVRGTVKTTFTNFSEEELREAMERHNAKTASAEADSAPATAPAPAPQEEGPVSAEATTGPVYTPGGMDPSLAVEAKKLLAALNKRTGRNAAKELLNGMGYKSFKDVPLEAVPDVIAKVKEADDAE